MFPQSCPHRGWSLSLLLSFCWSTYTLANRKSLQSCPYRGGSRFARQELEGSTMLHPTLGGRQPEKEILKTVLFFKINLDEVVNSASCICEMLMTCFFAISAISGKRWRHSGIKISSHWKNIINHWNLQRRKLPWFDPTCWSYMKFSGFLRHRSLHSEVSQGAPIISSFESESKSRSFLHQFGILFTKSM